MALETATYTSDLVVTNPTGSDALAFADDHLRLIKSALKNTFPSISGAVTKTHTEINDGLEKAGGTMTGALVLSGAPTADLEASTKAYVDAAIAATKNLLYPVGSIYTNASNATNPSTLLGFGTWVVFGEGRVLVGQNTADASFDVLEETGGSKDAVVVSHTHTFSTTTGDAGTHQHSLQFAASSADDGPTSAGGTRTDGGGVVLTMNGNHVALSAGNHNHAVSGTTASTGTSGTNANLQPYVVVKMWKRTA